MNEELYYEYKDRPTELEIQLCGRCKRHVLRELDGKSWCYQCGNTKASLRYALGIEHVMELPYETRLDFAKGLGLVHPTQPAPPTDS